MTFTKSQHFHSIDEALRSLFGNDVKIARTNSVAGGDINEAYRLTLIDGAQIFMKTNA